MNEHHWTKYGVLAIGGLGLVLLLVLIFNYGLNDEGDLEDRDEGWRFVRAEFETLEGAIPR